MHDKNALDLLDFWLNGMCALVSLLICSTFLFIICAKKLKKSTSSVHCVPDGSEVDINVYSRPDGNEFDQNIQVRPSATGKDFLSNPKKTDLIRLGKLKVDKRNPEYDTMVDIERELSLENVDEANRKLPKSGGNHTYEMLLTDDVKSASPKKKVPIPPIKSIEQQTSSKLATPRPRRESNPQPPATNLPRKSASKSKIIKVNPSKRVSINQVQSLVVTRICKTKKESKKEVVAPEKRRHSIALGKVDSRVGVHDLKPSQSCGTNLWMQRNQQQ